MEIKNSILEPKLGIDTINLITINYKDSLIYNSFILNQLKNVTIDNVLDYRKKVVNDSKIDIENDPLFYQIEIAGCDEVLKIITTKKQ